MKMGTLAQFSTTFPLELGISYICTLALLNYVPIYRSCLLRPPIKPHESSIVLRKFPASCVIFTHQISSPTFPFLRIFYILRLWFGVDVVGLNP